MPSPLPGMDPYLEQPETWAEFHNNLAAEIQGYLNQRIRPRYVARQVPVTTYDSIAITPTRLIKPDVSVFSDRRGREGSSRGIATLTPPAAETSAPLDYEVELFSVEVRAAGGRDLVTAIEILSPVNKRPGHDAYRDYHRKRRALLRSDANLLEIDLLRAGERPPVAPPPPPAPYYVLLTRASNQPRAPVWASRSRIRCRSCPSPCWSRTRTSTSICKRSWTAPTSEAATIPKSITR